MRPDYSDLRDVCNLGSNVYAHRHPPKVACKALRSCARPGYEELWTPHYALLAVSSASQLGGAINTFARAVAKSVGLATYQRCGQETLRGACPELVEWELVEGLRVTRSGTRACGGRDELATTLPG